MQAITHFLIGVILQILIFPFNHPIGLVIGILICFFSHFLVDCLAKITYHPATAQTGDKFWVVSHIFLIIGAGVVLVYFWNLYWIGMVFSVLVDIYDWGFIRGIRYLKKESDWFQRYQIHPFIDRIRDKIFFWLPNWNEKHYGIIPEVIFIGLLYYFIIYLKGAI